MSRVLFTLFAGLLALALVGCGATSGSSSGGSSTGERTQQEQQPGTSGPLEETVESTGTEEPGNPTLGDPDAPVVMIEWGDFQ